MPDDKRIANILYFAPCGLGEGVGGSARLKNMVDVLQRLELNVHLISYLPGEKFSVTHEQVNERLKTTTVSVRRSSAKIFKVLALGLIMMYGLKHVWRSNIIFAHAPIIVSGLPALILAKIFRKPLVIDHTDVKERDTPQFIYSTVLKNSAIVFAVSRYLEEEGKQLGSKKVIYIPGFVDANMFQKDSLQRRKIRESLGVAEKDIIIGYAGSFWYGEGVPFLVRAFKKLLKTHENIKLVVVGGRNVANSDNIAQIVEELGLREKVIVVPPQPYELMPQYLSAFDIACSPKIDCEENIAASPIKIYEYMATGLSMVVSAVGQPVSVIENGVDGFLVKPGDENDLERALEHLIQHPHLAQEVGQKAREKVIGNFTQQALSKKIEEALKPFLASQSSQGGSATPMSGRH